MLDPNKLIELAAQIQKPQERYLKWRQVCDRYERGVKSIFGSCFLSAAGENVREREATAYTDKRYADYLEAWDKAEKEKIKAQVEYDNLKTTFDAYQSALSYQREELKRGM